jgi:tetratricopeptide (TPR) repeat protein
LLLAICKKIQIVSNKLHPIPRLLGVGRAIQILPLVHSSVLNFELLIARDNDFGNKPPEQEMVADKPRYELHFHACVPSDITTESQKLTQVFPKRLAQLTPQHLHQLPQDLIDFTGRQKELDHILHSLIPTPLSVSTTESPDSSPLLSPSTTDANAIAMIIGTAGMGKSTLAIHAAHQLQPNFPDVQLYVNLRGSESQPLEPLDVLASFLRSWGVNDSSIPEGLTQRAKLYRSFLWGKRALIVLDNAHDSAQVRPLLPNSPSCAVLVTSRKRLAALEEATVLNLSVIAEDEALELFQKMVGVERTQAEQNAAHTILNLCGRVPLALRLAGGTIRHQPDQLLADYAHQLTQQRQHIAQLRLNHLEVRSSFALNYQQLNEVACRLFRLLGLLSGQNFAPTVAASLLESELSTAEQFVNDLVDLHLLESSGDGRYRFHDLIRLFAKEQLAQEEPAEARQEARLRVARGYTEVSEMMNLVLKPETGHTLTQALPASQPQSSDGTTQTWLARTLNWFESERMNLLASVEWAYQTQTWDIVVPLTQNLVNFFNLYAYHTDWERTHLMALEASRQLGNRLGEAQTLTNLGNVYALQTNWNKARECYEQSLIIFGELSDRLGVAKATGNLANIYTQQGNWAKASEYYEPSRVIFSELNDTYSEAQTLANIGIFYHQQGENEQAVRLWQDALSKLPKDLPKFQQVTEWLKFTQTSLGTHRIEEKQTPITSAQAVIAAQSTAVSRPGDIKIEQKLNLDSSRRRNLFFYVAMFIGVAIALLFIWR